MVPTCDQRPFGVDSSAVDVGAANVAWPVGRLVDEGGLMVVVSHNGIDCAPLLCVAWDEVKVGKEVEEPSLADNPIEICVKAVVQPHIQDPISV